MALLRVDHANSSNLSGQTAVGNRAPHSVILSKQNWAESFGITDSNGLQLIGMVGWPAVDFEEPAHDDCPQVSDRGLPAEAEDSLRSDAKTESRRVTWALSHLKLTNHSLSGSRYLTGAFFATIPCHCSSSTPRCHFEIPSLCRCRLR